MKRIMTIFFALIFVLIKKIFIRENRVPHKIMDTLANKLHSVFLFTAIPILYIAWFDIPSINTILYIFLFLQFVLIIRYFNPQMLQQKTLQITLTKSINKLFVFIFITNWIFLSFGLALLFSIALLINNVFYILIINLLKKQAEQEEFKKQFKEGTYTKTEMVETHILNLFETVIDIEQLTKSDIKKQYRIMAKKYHPDVYKGDEKDKFVSINSSYTYLLNLVK
jgi:hypothetical protein